MVASREIEVQSPPMGERLVREILRSAGLCVAAVVVVWLVPAAGVLVFLGLAGWAVTGPRRAVQALTVAWLLSSLNPVIYEVPNLGYRWLVIAAAALGLAVHWGLSDTRRFLRGSVAVLLFVVMAATSALFSTSPDLVLFKTAAFALGALTLLGLLRCAACIGREWSVGWFLGLFLAVVALSAPLLVHPNGYVVNGIGFQGILDHPQVLGVFLAPFVAGLLIVLVEGSTWRPPLLVAAVVGSGFLVATGARTGGVAVAVGFGLAMGVGLLAQRSGWRLPRHRRRELAVAGVLVLWVLIATPYAQGAIEAYVVKDPGDETLSLAQTFAEGRGPLVAESWARFAESPLLGRGFGVSASPDGVDTVGGIPASATVESGFVLSGILEQTGLLGLIAFLALLVVALRPVAQGRSLAAVALAAAAVGTNLGEATLFSFGGMGLFIWLIVLWAVVLSPSPDPAMADGSSG